MPTGMPRGAGHRGRSRRLAPAVFADRSTGSTLPLPAARNRRQGARPMTPSRRRPSAAHAILFLTFVESLATVLLERGVYFYTHDVLDSSERDNLLLATA